MARLATSAKLAALVGALAADAAICISLAPFGLVSDGAAEDIPGRKLRNSEFFDQNLSLRAFADAGWPQKDQSQRFRPPSRERFTSPSYCCAIRWDWTWLMVSRVTVTMINSEVPPMNWLTLSWLWISSGISATTIR